jgi:hypothetical protein
MRKFHLSFLALLLCVSFANAQCVNRSRVALGGSCGVSSFSAFSSVQLATPVVQTIAVQPVVVAQPLLVQPFGFGVVNSFGFGFNRFGAFGNGFGGFNRFGQFGRPLGFGRGIVGAGGIRRAAVVRPRAVGVGARGVGKRR